MLSLSLITDAYSHKIVGWAVGPTLETTYPLEALYMALGTIQGEEAEIRYCVTHFVAIFDDGKGDNVVTYFVGNLATGVIFAAGIFYSRPLLSSSEK